MERLAITLVAVFALGITRNVADEPSWTGRITCMDTSVNPQMLLSTIEFYEGPFQFFSIGLSPSGGYFSDMHCTLDWTAPPGWKTYVEFSTCDFYQPAECLDNASITLTGESTTRYCGGNPEGFNTYMDTMHIDFRTDDSGEGVGCNGFLMYFQGEGRRRRNTRLDAAGTPMVQAESGPSSARNTQLSASEKIAKRAQELRQARLRTKRGGRNGNNGNGKGQSDCNCTGLRTDCKMLRVRMSELSDLKVPRDERTRELCTDFTMKKNCVREYFTQEELNCEYCESLQLSIDVASDDPLTDAEYLSDLLMKQYKICDQVYGTHSKSNDTMTVLQIAR